MLARWPSAFVLSAAMHAAVIAAAVWLGIAFVTTPEPRQALMQFVLPSEPARAVDAGSGGSTPGIRFSAPRPPVVHPAPIVEPAPEAAPTSAPRRLPSENVRPTAVSPHAAPVANSTAHAPSHSARPAHAPAAAPVQHVDVTGITQALRSEVGPGAVSSSPAGEQDATYETLLEQRLREALERVPQLDDGLAAEAEFQVLSNGHTTGARLLRRSGNKRFDDAVLEAIRSLDMPPPPAGFSPLRRVPFTTHARQ